MHGERRPHIVLLDIVLQRVWIARSFGIVFFSFPENIRIGHCPQAPRFVDWEENPPPTLLPLNDRNSQLNAAI